MKEAEEEEEWKEGEYETMSHAWYVYGTLYDIRVGKDSRCWHRIPASVTLFFGKITLHEVRWIPSSWTMFKWKPSDKNVMKDLLTLDRVHTKRILGEVPLLPIWLFSQLQDVDMMRKIMKNYIMFSK